MSVAFYTGVAGMLASQTHMDITSNNIANVNTAGYKTQESAFADLLYTRMNTHRNYNTVVGEEDIPEDEKSYDMVGHGTRVAGVNLMYKQGGFLNTGRALDFAIDGEGLFAVETADGETVYTRNGSFAVTNRGRRLYLVNGDGSYVLDNRGSRITLETNESGGIDTDAIAEKLGIYHFDNPYGLIPTDGGSFRPSDVSGEAEAARGNNNDSTILQYYLENSNVELSDQMVNIIQAQRSFQMNSRVVQTADEIQEMINNLR